MMTIKIYLYNDFLYYLEKYKFIIIKMNNDFFKKIFDNYNNNKCICRKFDFYEKNIYMILIKNKMIIDTFEKPFEKILDNNTISKKLFKFLYSNDYHNDLLNEFENIFI
jgi:hypothetical protein